MNFRVFLKFKLINMKKTLLPLFLFISFFTIKLYASHALPIVGLSYTIGPTGVTISGSSDAATCAGGAPYWMQTKVTCNPALFANTMPDACLNSYLQSWSSPGVTFNSFPWFNSLLDVPNYDAANSWPDACVTEPYHNTFIPFADLCPGKVYYFATRELVTNGSGNVGPFGPVNSFTVPGTFVPCIPGFITSNPVTSPTSPSCGGGVLLTFHPPVGCSEKKTPIPGCGTCDTLVWQSPTGVVAVNTLTVMVFPTATTTYTLAWDTCSPIRKVNCCCAPYDPTITVYVANVNALFTASNNTICAGASVAFNAIVPSPVDLWTVSPTTSVTPSSGGSSTFNATFDLPGTYVVTHQSINGPCTDIKTQTITVGAGITSSITTSGGGCGSGAGTGSATVAVTSSTAGLTYTWAPSGGNASSASGLTFNTTYTVTLSNVGCTITKTIQITNNIAPVVTSFSVTPPCNGQSNGVVAVNLSNGNPPFTFTWSPTITQTTQTVTGVAAGTYSVFVSDNNGCLTNSVVTVNQPSALTLTTTSSTTASICSGTSASLTAAGGGGTPAYSYTWNPGNITTATAVITPTNATTYSCTVTDGNGCVTTNTLAVAVTPPLIVTVASKTICAGGSTVLTPSVVSAGNGGTITYTWLPSGVNTPTLSYTSAIIGSQTFSLITSDGCSIPNSTAVYTVVTTSAPVINSFSVNPPTCNGLSNGTVAVNVTGGGAPFSFTWIPTITQTTQTVTGVAAGTYSVFISNTGGCITNSVVTVTQPSAITLTTSTSATICSGRSTTLTATGGGGTPVYSYTWNPGNITTSSAVVSPSTTTNYTCTIKDANGCSTTNIVNVMVTPPLAVSVSSQTICIGNSAVFTPSVTSPGNGGVVTYTWLPSGTTSSTYSVNGTTSGTTNYTLIASDGCSVPTSTLFSVFVSPNPIANIVADSLVGYAPLQVDFNDLGSGGTSFNWNFGNGNSSTIQNPTTQVYSIGGNYLVTYTVTNAFGCSAYDTLNINVIDLAPAITVPNVFTPNGDRTNDLFKVTGVNITSYECVVYNRWGKLVFSSSDLANAWDGKINGNPADEGTYFYIIKASGAVGDPIKKEGYVSVFR